VGEARRQEALTLTLQNQLLRMIACGAAVGEVLEAVVATMASLYPDAGCAVLLLEEDGITLRHAATTGVPEAFVRALDGTTLPGESGAVRNRPHGLRQCVHVSQLASDSFWSGLCEAATSANLTTCWAEPICAEAGQLFGMLLLYWRREQEPDSTDWANLETFTPIAGIAIERERQQAVMMKLMYCDALTGLPNRTHLWRHLQGMLTGRGDPVTGSRGFRHELGDGASWENQEVGQDVSLSGVFTGLAANSSDYVLSALFLDVDRFRIINETMDHGVGDQLLRMVGCRLKKYFAGEGMVVRFGGDEFVVIWPGRADQLESIVRRFLASFSEGMNVQQHVVNVTVSAGIAERAEGQSGYELLKRAETAMYVAKEASPGQVRQYEPSMTESIIHQNWLAEELRGALDRGEMSLVYQPKQHMQSGGITGVEALLRWRHPELGAISPGEFIPVAEKSDLIIAIGDWVIAEVCDQIAEWKRVLPQTPHVAVNISARQFACSDFIDKLSQSIARAGIECGLLQLELTETTLMDRTEEIQERLKHLRSIGVKVAIDDFGVAYSSLGYLQRFAIDALKIDRSFVSGIEVDSNAIVTAIISLAHSLCLRVVAEGVETAEQRAFLESHACDEMQGFLFAKPMSAAQLMAFLASHPVQTHGDGRDSARGGPLGIASAESSDLASSSVSDEPVAASPRGMLATLADEVGLLRRKVRDYEWLDRCLTPAMSAEDVLGMMATVRDFFSERFDFDRFGILIGTVNERYCVIHELVTSSGMEAIPAGALMVVKDTGLERVFATGALHYNPDMLTNQEFSEDEYLSSIGLRSMVRIPLLHKGSVFGVMTVKTGRPDYYSADDLALMNVVAGRLSTGLYALKLIYTLRESGYRDPLTKIWNRGFLADLALEDKQEVVEEVSGRFFEAGDEVGVLFIDVNRFKVFNDTCGHVAGDEFLRHVASALDEALGDRGWAVRYGGDEFVGILPHSSMADLYSLAGVLRLRLGDMAMHLSRSISGAAKAIPSFSVGIATGPWTELEHLLAIADECMYEDKANQSQVTEQQA